MISRELPWSWRAWAAIVPAAGIVGVVALFVFAVAKSGGMADARPLAQAMDLQALRSFGIMFLVSGIGAAFWLLLPLFAARATPHPAVAFLALAPVIAIGRGVLGQARAAAKAAQQPLLEDLPSVVANISWSEWFMLLTVALSHLAGAVAYLIVVRAVKPSP